MRIAIISFDQEFSKKIKDSLGDEHQVRIYIDSLGMLRDLKEFTPDIIIYDASAGEFAIDDLKFLMTRDKLENIEFKIFISKIEPINVDELPKKIPKEIFYKDDEDVNKLVVKLKSTGLIEEDLSQDLLLNNEMPLEIEKEEKGANLDNLLSQSPEDIEDLLMGGSIEEEKPKEEKPKKKEKEEIKAEAQSKPPSDELFNEDIPLDEIESILEEFSLGEESKEKEEVKPIDEVKPKESIKKKAIKQEQEEELNFKSEDIEELLGLSEFEPKREEKEKIPDETKEKKVKKEDFLADIEDLLTVQHKNKKEEIIEEKEKIKENNEERAFKTEDIEDLLSDIGLYKEEKEEKKDKVVDEELTQVEKPKVGKSTVKEISEPHMTEETTIAKSVVKSGGSIKLEISISEEEIKNLIVKETVNRMVEELKNDAILKELIENIQKDFIDRTEKELESLKEVVKVEVKTKLLKKIEDDLKEKVKESIKKDVMEITTKLVKYKLEQIFGK